MEKQGDVVYTHLCVYKYSFIIHRYIDRVVVHERDYLCAAHVAIRLL